jgi:hypothetical protein
VTFTRLVVVLIVGLPRPHVPGDRDPIRTHLVEKRTHLVERVEASTPLADDHRAARRGVEHPRRDDDARSVGPQAHVHVLIQARFSVQHVDLASERGVPRVVHAGAKRDMGRMKRDLLSDARITTAPSRDAAPRSPRLSTRSSRRRNSRASIPQPTYARRLSLTPAARSASPRRWRAEHPLLRWAR